jgi:hypothetical protein
MENPISGFESITEIANSKNEHLTGALLNVVIFLREAILISREMW